MKFGETLLYVKDTFRIRFLNTLCIRIAYLSLPPNVYLRNTFYLRFTENFVKFNLQIRREVYKTNAKSILLVSFTYSGVSPNLILSIYFSIYTFYIRVLYSVNILITYVLTIRFIYFFNIRIIYSISHTHFITLARCSKYIVYIRCTFRIWKKYITSISSVSITYISMTVTGSKPKRDITYH